MEPLPESSPLWLLPDSKILITAHNADLTVDYYQLGWDVWGRNYDAFMRKGELVTPVNVAAGY